TKKGNSFLGRMISPNMEIIVEKGICCVCNQSHNSKLIKCHYCSNQFHQSCINKIIQLESSDIMICNFHKFKLKNNKLYILWKNENKIFEKKISENLKNFNIKIKCEICEEEMIYKKLKYHCGYVFYFFFF